MTKISPGHPLPSASYSTHNWKQKVCQVMIKKINRYFWHINIHKGYVVPTSIYNIRQWIFQT